MEPPEKEAIGDNRRNFFDILKNIPKRVIMKSKDDTRK